MTRSARNCAEPPLRNPLAALTPIASPVHDQQAEIADRFVDDDEESSDEEDVDETAELYDPDGRSCRELTRATAVANEPVLSTKPSRAPVARSRSLRRRSRWSRLAGTGCRRRAGRARRPRRAPRRAQGQGGVHAAARPERHLKLRLACAVTGRSAQQLVTDALDQLLGACPNSTRWRSARRKKRARAERHKGSDDHGEVASSGNRLTASD